MAKPSATLEIDPLWFKKAIVYEAHVRAFYDQSGDGMGDFAGLTEKLDYLEDLGVTAVWLLPFCPSPWRDDGYDISDYANVHPAYGTLRDFENFLHEAHRRGLRVITELVLNHTSDQHAWFQRSRRAPAGSRWRNFYVWSDSPERYHEARVIFKDFETSNWTWDSEAKAYYWHRFYSHQPDLNFDSPDVRTAMLEAVDFWLDMGVDGLRLDAVPYLYEREGTICENLPETHQFLRELRAHVDGRHKDKMLLAEANQWPEEAISYFGSGDECHMAFHFPLMPRLFMAIRMEDRYPVTDIMDLTPEIPANCQWALFLRNHDELTLEMVTDEERDYMYRVYAQDRNMRINLGIRRRLAPLLENDRRRIELMNGLLCSLPGTPVIYYGDEIGMGDNIYLGDRNGVRTPMQWSSDRNAGFSRANPQRLYLPVNIDPEYHYEAINVETQQNNPHSLLWWMKRLLAQRKQLGALGRGTLEFLHPENRRILAFMRNDGEERVLVVANLSRFTQCTELDLAPYAGMIPLEVFGKSIFPAINEQPYFLSLGPHAFHWFALQPQDAAEPGPRTRTEPPVLRVESWENVFEGSLRDRLNPMLPAFLRSRRWFRGGKRRIRTAEIYDVIPFPRSSSYVLILRTDYTEGEPELYVVAVAAFAGEGPKPDFILARLLGPGGGMLLLGSALRNPDFCQELLTAMMRRRRYTGEAGELAASHTRQLTAIWHAEPEFETNVTTVDQDNTTILFSDRLVVKLMRKVESGPHPEREILARLTELGFPNTPTLAGAIEYRNRDGDNATVALLESYVPDAVQGWQYTRDHLGLFFETAMARGPAGPPEDAAAGELVGELMGSYLEWVRLLGQRTAELHIALASSDGDSVWAPEPFTDFYRHGLYHAMIGRLNRAMDQLKSGRAKLPAQLAGEGDAVIEREQAIRARFRVLRDQRLAACRIRIHGDYHLGQVLYTGKDFVMVDFEGDPGRPLSERRIKRSPLEDVAGIIESLYAASHGVLWGEAPGVIATPERMAAISAWARYWSRGASRALLDSYMETPGITPLLPQTPEQVRMLLRLFLMDLALRKLNYELLHAPDHIGMPCHLLLDLLEVA